MSKGIHLMWSRQVWSKPAWAASQECQPCTLLITLCLQEPGFPQPSPWVRVLGVWADSTTGQLKVETGRGEVGVLAQPCQQRPGSMAGVGKAHQRSGIFSSAEESTQNNSAPSINLKFAEFTRLTKNPLRSSISSATLPASSSFLLCHHLMHTLHSAIGKRHSRDLLQWLTRAHPRLSLLFRSHTSSAPYLSSWAGIQADSGKPLETPAVGTSSSPSCLCSYAWKNFSKSTLLLCILSGNRNVCDYVWWKLVLEK